MHVMGDINLKSTGVMDRPLSRFSSAFRQALVKRYGRLPSAPFVAREFNLRHKGSRTISSESARRWLHGDCLPHLDRLETISAWLGIGIDSAFLPHTKSEGYQSMENASPWPVSLNEEQRDCLKRLLMTLYPELDLTRFG